MNEPKDEGQGARDRDELLRLREENLRLREEGIVRRERASARRKTEPTVVNVKQVNESALSGCASGLFGIIGLIFLLAQCSH